MALRAGYSDAVNLGCAVPLAMKERLIDAAHAEDRSVSSIVRAAIQEHLARLDRTAQVDRGVELHSVPR
jgi:hypothetical protein